MQPSFPTGLLALVQIYYSIDLFTPSLANSTYCVYVRKYTTQLWTTIILLRVVVEKRALYIYTFPVRISNIVAVK